MTEDAEDHDWWEKHTLNYAEISADDEHLKSQNQFESLYLISSKSKIPASLLFLYAHMVFM